MGSCTFYKPLKNTVNCLVSFFGNFSCSFQSIQKWKNTTKARLWSKLLYWTLFSSWEILYVSILIYNSCTKMLSEFNELFSYEYIPYEALQIGFLGKRWSSHCFCKNLNNKKYHFHICVLVYLKSKKQIFQWPNHIKILKVKNKTKFEIFSFKSNKR